MPGPEWNRVLIALACLALLIALAMWSWAAALLALCVGLIILGRLGKP